MYTIRDKYFFASFLYIYVAVLGVNILCLIFTTNKVPNIFLVTSSESVRRYFCVESESLTPTRDQKCSILSSQSEHNKRYFHASKHKTVGDIEMFELGTLRVLSSLNALVASQNVFTIYFLKYRFHVILKLNKLNGRLAKNRFQVIAHRNCCCIQTKRNKSEFKFTLNQLHYIKGLFKMKNIVEGRHRDNFYFE